MKSNEPSFLNSPSLIPRWVKVLFLFFAVLIVVVVVQRGRQPRYEGQTMDEWLRVFIEDKPKWGWGPDLTLQQQKAVDAFEYFGQEGFDFLTERATRDLSVLDETYIWLNRIDLVDELEIFPDRSIDVSVTYNLRSHMQVPVEWIEPHLQANSGNSPEEISERLRLMRSVTNRFKEFVPLIGPYMNHTNMLVKSEAMLAMKHCYVDGAYYPEVEPFLVQFAATPSQIRWHAFTHLMIKHAQRSEWAKQYWKDAAKDSNTANATRAMVAMMNVPDLREYAISELSDLLRKTIDAPGFQHPSRNPDVDRMFHELSYTDVPMDPAIQPVLVDLLEKFRDSSSGFDIPEIFIQQGWHEHPEMVEYVRQRMTSRRGEMGHSQFEAFHWLLDRDPEDETTWQAYDRIMESASPVEVSTNLRELAVIPKPSKAAVQRLKHYAKSERESYRIAAEQTLAKMKETGLLPNDPE